MYKRIILLILYFFCFVSCDILTYNSIADIESVYDSKVKYEYVNSNEVLNRAYQMAMMEWVPLKPVPTNNKLYFEGNKKVIGVPYSSVKEINTYLFQDVSYHTFISSVKNPNSVLYTENISCPPYHGLNCATYYGSVCSSSILWAFGIDIPYYANQIIKLSCVDKIDQNIDSLKVCDIMWCPGHVQMVYNIEYKVDKICQISTFESSGHVAHISTYSREDFIKLWETTGYIGYRYKYIEYSNNRFVPSPFNNITINNDMCPSKGDRAVYRTEDIISINIFSSNYKDIILYKDGVELSRSSLKGNMYQFVDLSPGLYSVRICNNNFYSDPVHFEVIDTFVDCRFYARKRELEIKFLSSSNPKYVILCTMVGDSIYFPISEEERKQGCIIVPQCIDDELYCKVVYGGRYGNITNIPLRIK